MYALTNLDDCKISAYINEDTLLIDSETLFDELVKYFNKNKETLVISHKIYIFLKLLLYYVSENKTDSNKGSKLFKILQNIFYLKEDNNLAFKKEQAEAESEAKTETKSSIFSFLNWNKSKPTEEKILTDEEKKGIKKFINYFKDKKDLINVGLSYLFKKDEQLISKVK